ncbi:hydroxyacid dehydrogenase [Pseudactinotalea suaedae]|uniref:hydroxyacid dehydrogenase n=1 Tax=Pseudactinotalea suaedae TaxID=1524924 RepID=UPI0012E250FF|nr:hydroxyacid dehydrogenase [Pseudactinotalea suaedae]
MDDPQVLLVMDGRVHQQLFGRAELERLRALAVLGDPAWSDRFDDATMARLADVEVLITSWGCPPITTQVLDGAPRLRAVLHAAGSVRSLVPPEAYARGITVVSGADANAIPVAEFALAAIILAGKRAVPLAAANRERPVSWGAVSDGELSNLGRTIGLVGFSRIGRRTLELIHRVLQPAGVLVADPYAQAADVAAAGGELVSLPSLLRSSEILSLHAPLGEATRGMIGAAELALLPDGATLINTARGGLVDHDALLRECAAGRIDAILDVTEPEPLPRGHGLLALPNVMVTPHLAGSLGSETRRLAHHALDALADLVAGAPVRGAVSVETVGVSA